MRKHQNVVKPNEHTYKKRVQIKPSGKKSMENFNNVWFSITNYNPCLKLFILKKQFMKAYPILKWYKSLIIET